MTMHENEVNSGNPEPVSQPGVDISPRFLREDEMTKLRNQRNGLGVATAALATVIFAGALTGAYAMGRLDSSVRATDNPGASAGEGATPTPSEAAGSASPEATEALGLLSPEAMVALVGRDAHSRNIENWNPIIGPDNTIIGGYMIPEPSGLNSVVEVTGIGQAYLEAKVEGKYQAIALILPDGETFPVRGISIYPTDFDKDKAFEGALDLENRTQPGVYVVEICDTMQAIPENKQDLSNPAQWEAEKITSEEAAKRFGKDKWSQNPENWTIAPDGYGMVLRANPNGLNSVIFTDRAVAQAYWDAQVEGIHQAIAITLGVGVEVPVRGATVYTGVPEGMETEAVEHAFKQAVNYEIETQLGVFVGLVCKTAQAMPESAALATPEPTTAPEATQESSTPAPERTPAPTRRPEVTPRPTEEPDWYADNIREIGNKGKTELLPDGGLKIKANSVISIQVDRGEKALYWDGTQEVWVNGPVTIQAQDATVYQR